MCYIVWRYLEPAMYFKWICITYCLLFPKQEICCNVTNQTQLLVATFVISGAAKRHFHTSNGKLV